jgi:hypothetical protein
VSHALLLLPRLLQALVRRATALQELDDLEHALADAQKVSADASSQITSQMQPMTSLNMPHCQQKPSQAF